MITSPKVIATPTWPSACVFALTITAPAPANTNANVPIASATSAPTAPASAAACAGRLKNRQSLALGRARFARLDDRAVHPVCHLVRELDRHILETGLLEPRDVLRSRQRAGDAADETAARRALV